MHTLPTLREHQWQYAFVAAASVGAAASLVTLILMGLTFMFLGDLHYGQPMALYMNQLHITPFMMPEGALDAAAWLVLVAGYAGLLVSIPAFVIFKWGGPDQA